MQDIQDKHENVQELERLHLVDCGPSPGSDGGDRGKVMGSPESLGFFRLGI